MKRIATLTALGALIAGQAGAGGVERSAQSAGILFEDGDRVELSFGYVSPDVSGEQLLPVGPTSPAGASSGDMSEDHSTLAFGYKQQVNESVALALIVDNPIGADVNYGSDTQYLYGGGAPFAALGLNSSTAEIDSAAVTALASYKLPSNVTLFGGLRAQQASGGVSLFNGYEMETSSETDYGYVLGAAYERPDIALRVALTYNSEITHDFSASETVFDPATQSVSNFDTSFETTVPQSLNLEVQSGIAPDTLAFGSVRWVDWSEFDITPSVYNTAYNGSLVNYDDDVITYTVGLGRRFTENWSGAVLATYEDQNGGFSGNLGPTDGQTSVGVAVTYETERYEITGGLRHIWIGDARTEAPSALDQPAGTAFGDFDDNTAIAGGLQVAIKF